MFCVSLAPSAHTDNMLITYWGWGEGGGSTPCVSDIFRIRSVFRSIFFSVGLTTLKFLGNFRFTYT